MEYFEHQFLDIEIIWACCKSGQLIGCGGVGVALIGLPVWPSVDHKESVAREPGWHQGDLSDKRPGMCFGMNLLEIQTPV